MIAEQTLGIRQLVDPDGTLPEIEVVPQFKPEQEGSYHLYDLRYDAIRVGFMEIHRSGAETDMFADVEVVPGIQRGLGLAAYVWAIEHSQKQGRGFSTGDAVSPSAHHIWEILISRGAVDIVTPLRRVLAIDEHIGTVEFYTGYCFIGAPPYRMNSR